MTIEEILKFIKDNQIQIYVLGVTITFLFGVYKFYIRRKTELYWKEFEIYHKLLKDLVQPEVENGSVYLDRQVAIIFELKNFKRYYPISEKILKELRKKWISNNRLIEEIDLTLEHIRCKNECYFCK
ncbi:hypothetical protein [Aliarcobacter cryaerophilus]|uniref:hypothetical protein n=1 Tax=Aliarcobacter cryaerophilus TaxID=28198 RepID=UPI0021B6BE4E|nr:hypothetical protein [Aliarcobacter cryaerophilus]MCT7492519.1 hypothetical protein [Aliarcobacter cryaerophilus]